MTNVRLSIVPFALVALAIGGCSEGEAVTPEVVGTPAQAAAAEAAYSAGALDAAMLDNGTYADYSGGFWLYATAEERPYPRPVDTLLRTWGAVVSTSCVSATTMEGMLVDADRDGIPVSYDANFRCSDQTIRDRNVRVNGRVVVQDASDTNPNSGFTVFYEDFKVRVQEPNGLARTRSLNGSVTMKLSGGTYELTQNVENILTIERPENPTTSATYSGATTTLYTPDASVAGVDPFAVGTVTTSGRSTLEESGFFYALDRTTEPGLHWNRGCRAASPSGVGYDEGVMQVASTGGLKARIEFQSCTTTKTTF